MSNNGSKVRWTRGENVGSFEALFIPARRILSSDGPPQQVGEQRASAAERTLSLPAWGGDFPKRSLPRGVPASSASSPSPKRRRLAEEIPSEERTQAAGHHLARLDDVAVSLSVPKFQDPQAFETENSCSGTVETPRSRGRPPKKKATRRSAESQAKQRAYRVGGKSARAEVRTAQRKFQKEQRNRDTARWMRLSRQRAKLRREPEASDEASHKLGKAEEMTPAVHSEVPEEVLHSLQRSTGALKWTPEARASAKSLRLGKRYVPRFQRRLKAQIGRIPALQRTCRKNLRRIKVSCSKLEQIEKVTDMIGITPVIKRIHADLEVNRNEILREAWGCDSRRRAELKRENPRLLRQMETAALNVHLNRVHSSLGPLFLQWLVEQRRIAWLQLKNKGVLSLLRQAQARKVVDSFRDWMQRWKTRAKYDKQNRKRKETRKLKKHSVLLYKKLLLKYSGVPSLKQKGSRPARLRKEKAFVTTMKRRVFESSMKRLPAAGSSKRERLAHSQRRLKLREECRVAVEKALLLKRNLYYGFRRSYCLLVRVVKDVEEEVAARKDSPQPLSWKEALLRLKDGESEPELPEGWGEALEEKLSGLPDAFDNVHDCMRALMELEACDGCEPREQTCEYGYDGCQDAVRQLLRGRPHSSRIRQLLDKGFYEARALIMDIACVDNAVLECDAEGLQKALESLWQKGCAQKKSDSSNLQPRANTDLFHFKEQWGKVEEEFREAEQDMPSSLDCQWCNELVPFSKMLKRPHQSVLEVRQEKVQKGFLASLRRKFSRPSMTAEQSAEVLPLRACLSCWESVKKGELRAVMEENGMVVDPVPPEISELNQYEKLLIARAKQFVSCIRLRPLGKHRLPDRFLLPATKGNSVNLRIPTSETLAHVAGTVPLAQKPSEVLRIYVDVKTSAKKVWRNLVDLKKVLRALLWLKANNPFYKDVVIDAAALMKVDPAEFIKLVGPGAGDPNLEEEAEEMGEGEGNPLPPLSQPQHFLTQERPEHLIADEYILEPVHTEQVKVGEDVTSYMQTRIQGDPIGQQTKNLDVMCFPELFPRGRGGIHQSRPVPIRPKELFAHLLRHKDPRFRRCTSFAQMMHFHLRDRAIGQGIYASTKTGSGLHGLTAAQLKTKCQKAEEEVEKELTSLFAKIKGTKEYWNQAGGDLAAMSAELGPATFFVTLSSGETRWEYLKEMLGARNADIFKDPSKAYIADLISRDHVAVAQFFWRRFQALMKIIAPREKGQPVEGPLGVVEHFYWRLEYQARGNQHIHMKLWVKDAPILGAPGVTEESVQEFISKYITCELPSREKNPELRRLVETVQSHKCTSSCMRFKKGKGRRGRLICRYAFPRPAQDNYSFNPISDVVKSKAKGKKPKKMYQIPRSRDEVRINDYNPTLLMLTGANMDVQYVGEKSRVLDGYITGYMTKEEKNRQDNIYQNLSEEAESRSLPSRLRSLVLKVTQDRECGIYEVIDNILGHNLHGSSMAVNWLGVGLPEKRSRKLKSWTAVSALAESSPNSTDIYAKNLVEDYYPQRHDDLEDMSLHDIVRDWHFEVRHPDDTKKAATAAANPDTWKLCRDACGWFRRQKAVVVKTPYVPCTKDRSEELFHNLLQEFVPYRKEEELRVGKATFAEAFEHWVQLKPALWQGKSKLDTIEASKELYRQLLLEAAEEEAAEAELPPSQRSDSPAPPPNPVSRTGFRAKAGYGSEAGLKSRVESLNGKQRAVWEEVVASLAHQQRHQTSECQCASPPPQVLKFISGGAGVGKSRLIETLTEAVEAEDGQVVLAAPSGLAAQNIDGVTCHSAFRLPVQKNAGPWQYQQLAHQAEKDLHHKIGQAKLIIIDEISMVSNTMLEFIHLRLNSMMGKEPGDGSVFGGMNVVVLGDLLQLPPVNAPYCFEQIKAQDYRKMIRGSVGLVKPEHLWRRFSYAELTENMRQKGDGAFADLLNRLRLGNTDGMEMLEERVEAGSGSDAKSIAGLLTRLENQGKRPVCLLPTVDRVNQVNAAMLVSKGLPHRFLHAVDQLTNRKPRSTAPKAKKDKRKKAAGKTAPDPVAEIVDYINDITQRKTRDTGGMPQVLALAPGARVMLVRNLDVEQGLFNGAMGTLKKMIPDPSAPDGIGHLLVDFDGVGEEVIERQQGSYFVGGAEVKRSQFPLSLAYALTIHKSQGLSLDCVVTDLASHIFAAGMAYVALSRCRTLQGLHLLGVEKGWFTCDLKAVSEYNRLRKAFTDLPEMVAVRQEKPRMMRKRPLSRPLADAGLALAAQTPSSSPPSKNAKNRKPRRKAPSSPSSPVPRPQVKKPRAELAKKAKATSSSAGYRGQGFVPLENGQNWCFANAAVQSLLACASVADWAKAASPQDSAIRRSLKELVEAQDDLTPSAKNTAMIRQAIDVLQPQRNFLDGQQHDSSEFLENVLSAEPHLKDLFWVEVREKKQCRDCGTRSEQASDGLLTLPLKREGDGMVSWDSLLRDFLVEEKEVRCDVCVVRRGEQDLPERQRRNSRVLYSKEILFPEANRLLLVRVPRFSQLGVRNPDTRVSGFKAGDVEIGGTRLRVVAAVIHEGETANRGHYLCLSRHGTDWLLKSDSAATPHKKFLTQLNLRKDASAAYLVLQRQL